MITSKFSGFYGRSGLFIALSAIGAFLNYCLYLVLARVLSVSEFGDFAVVIALSNQVLGILLAINLVNIYLVKSNESKVARAQAQTIQKLLLWIFLIVVILLALLSHVLAGWLSIENSAALMVLALILLASVPSVVWAGYLQGHKKLVDVGLYNFSASLFKFLFAIGLAAVGGVVGGLVGVLAGVLLGLIVLNIASKVELPSVVSAISKLTVSDKQTLANLRGYIAGAIIVVGTISVLQSIDITYAKVFFEPHVAGLYSGIGIIGYAIYYVALLLVWVVLPELSTDNPNQNKRILGTFYKLLGLMAAILLLVLWMFKDGLTSLLLSDMYESQSYLLVYSSLYQLILVAITMYAYYLVVMRKMRAMLLAGCIFIPTLIAPALFADNPKQMIITLITSSLLGLAIYFSIIGILRAGKKIG